MKLRILKNEHLLFCQNWQLDQIHSFLHRKTQWHLSVFPLSVCLSSLDVLLTSQPMDTASRPTAMPGHRYTPPPGPPLDTLVPESEVDSQGVWDLTVTSVGYSQSFSSVSSRLKLIIINRFIF